MHSSYHNGDIDNDDNFVKQLLTSIENFKRSTYDQMSESDKTRLRLWTQKLLNLQGVPRYYGHFTTCPYASHRISTHDCPCNVLEIIEFKFDKLLAANNIQTL